MKNAGAVSTQASVARFSPGRPQETSDAALGLPKRFGDYLLVHRLGRGGMGDVFLAKQVQGFAGIRKVCVIKSIRAQYTEEAEYLRRFLDEARTVVELNHQNICQVYDVGAVGRQVYLSMEYIAGRDLKSVYERAADKKSRLPSEVSVHVVAEVLEALDYAHRLEDPLTSRSLALVHRDVSLQNVMLTFEGEVKLIDFGLAHSTRKVEHTQPGIVMGKLAYMSPEQARGDPVDRRADVFAAGVTLYELLVGERYYEGMSLDAVWGCAGKGTYRARKLDEIDPHIRPVLMHALAPNPDSRYSTCAEFRRDLVTAQLKRNIVAGSEEIRTLLERMFPHEREATRELRARVARAETPGEASGERAISLATSVDMLAELGVHVPGVGDRLSPHEVWGADAAPQQAAASSRPRARPPASGATKEPSMPPPVTPPPAREATRLPKEPAPPNARGRALMAPDPTAVLSEEMPRSRVQEIWHRSPWLIGFFAFAIALVVMVAIFVVLQSRRASVPAPTTTTVVAPVTRAAGRAPRAVRRRVRHAPRA